MPYITREERAELDKEVEALVKKLAAAPPEKMDGRLNYVITRLLAQLYPPGYFNYNRAMGVLSSVAHEYYRRRVAPYEDEKIKQNGDVY
ncbi:MAG: hypothetical protein QW470_01455 [Candidatus Caldarchaeum sp.]